jgi:hypothetical protein
MWQNMRACQTVTNDPRPHINAELLLVCTQYSFRDNSQTKRFWTHVDMDIFSCSGMWNSCTPFSYTLHIFSPKSLIPLNPCSAPFPVLIICYFFKCNDFLQCHPVPTYGFDYVYVNLALYERQNVQTVVVVSDGITVWVTLLQQSGLFLFSLVKLTYFVFNQQYIMPPGGIFRADGKIKQYLQEMCCIRYVSWLSQ